MEDQRLAYVPPVLLLGWRGVVQENDDDHAGDGGDRGEDEAGQEEHGKSAKKAEKAGRPVEVAKTRSGKEFSINCTTGGLEVNDPSKPSHRWSNGP